MLVDEDNFKYWFKSEYKAKMKSYYKCDQVEKRSCKVHMTYDETQDLVIKSSNLPHNHDSNILEVVVENAAKSMVKEVFIHNI